MAPQPELVQRSTVHEMNMIVYKDIYRPCSNKKHLSTEQQKELVRWKKAAEYYFSLALPLIGVPCGDYEAGAEAATGEYYFPLSELSTVRGCLEHLKRQVAEGKITDPDQLPLFGAPLDDNHQPVFSPQPYSIIFAEIELILLKHCLIWVPRISSQNGRWKCAERWENSSPGSEFKRLEQAVLEIWNFEGEGEGEKQPISVAQILLRDELVALTKHLYNGARSKLGQDELSQESHGVIRDEIRREELGRILKANEEYYTDNTTITIVNQTKPTPYFPRIGQALSHLTARTTHRGGSSRPLTGPSTAGRSNISRSIGHSVSQRKRDLYFA